MAASTTSGFSLHVPSPTKALPVTLVRKNRLRHITPEAGHALEKLGHAIEYLSDEFVHQGGDLRQHNPQVEAVQMLMALNRQIYFNCPEIPTLADRFRALLKRNVH